MKHPLDAVKWVKTTKLCPNAYNPNTVYDAELRLLKRNIMAMGWAQPILARKQPNEDGTYPIIDGYHRWWLTSNDPEMIEFTEGKVPVCFLSMTDAQAMVLTIRINRAKGSHLACKMHDIVKALYDKDGMSKKGIAEEIGASITEVELLLADGVFDQLDTKRHKYSKAWVPKNTDENYLENYLPKNKK